MKQLVSTIYSGVAENSQGPIMEVKEGVRGYILNSDCRTNLRHTRRSGVPVGTRKRRRRAPVVCRLHVRPTENSQNSNGAIKMTTISLRIFLN